MRKYIYLSFSFETMIFSRCLYEILSYFAAIVWHKQNEFPISIFRKIVINEKT